MAGNQARCAITYSLFVPHSRELPKMDRYLTALQARQVEAVHHFPGWELRLYLDGRFTKGMADVIRKLGYTVVHLPPSNTSLPKWHHMASRMRIIDDPDVDVFMMRDLDSALSPIGVLEWQFCQNRLTQPHLLHAGPRRQACPAPVGDGGQRPPVTGDNDWLDGARRVRRARCSWGGGPKQAVQPARLDRRRHDQRGGRVDAHTHHAGRVRTAGTGYGL